MNNNNYKVYLKNGGGIIMSVLDKLIKAKNNFIFNYTGLLQDIQKDLINYLNRTELNDYTNFEPHFNSKYLNNNNKQIYNSLRLYFNNIHIILYNQNFILGKDLNLDNFIILDIFWNYIKKINFLTNKDFNNLLKLRKLENDFPINKLLELKKLNNEIKTEYIPFSYKKDINDTDNILDIKKSIDQIEDFVLKNFKLFTEKLEILNEKDKSISTKIKLINKYLLTYTYALNKIKLNEVFIKFKITFTHDNDVKNLKDKLNLSQDEKCLIPNPKHKLYIINLDIIPDVNIITDLEKYQIKHITINGPVKQDYNYNKLQDPQGKSHYFIYYYNITYETGEASFPLKLANTFYFWINNIINYTDNEIAQDNKLNPNHNE